VILALSGVEAVANLTGVLKLDKGSNLEDPKVGKTAAKAIMPVAIEVVLEPRCSVGPCFPCPTASRPPLSHGTRIF